MIKANCEEKATFGEEEITGYGATPELARMDVIERIRLAVKEEARKRETMCFEQRVHHAQNIVDHSEQLATAI
ncbi:hypothetical protein HBA55_29495 [Pseudomaricurvus alkylphenolicus]|uniref:hypothetical protein n=1 Tax=Pseudomaricurvus alkylphenolicus TaxID=1306991 RepID=UPI0014210CB1|nr:hypothetical protein [Pseudomaricurvus alkylphenolicus]NIB43773.1 hypothetical protein [Pseudomaricurvus alkylphenolicus]